VKNSSEINKDIIQWDIKSWSKALDFWERNVPWEKVNKCLELGGREGGLSLWMALKGKEVVCSDYEHTKETAQKLHLKYNLEEQIQYMDIDATNIPFENHFDVIVFKSIIGGIGYNNNLEAQKLVFNQIYKALKPGGKLLFAENLVASPFHVFFRNKFIKWGNSWRYINKSETIEFLKEFKGAQIKTNGFLAAFGRSESQRAFFSYFDRYLFNWLFPESWKYIIYGIAIK
jgi:SAM-dependent methyltransferase